jgi:copper chaperone
MMVSLNLISLPDYQETTMQLFHVENMTCQGCANAITRALQAVDANAVVKTFPPIRQVRVESTLSNEQLLGIFAEAGYPAQPFSEK